MFLGLASAFEEHVLDLKDVVDTLEKKYGKQVDLAYRSTYNPFTNKQFALCDMWVPDPIGLGLSQDVDSNMAVRNIL